MDLEEYRRLWKEKEERDNILLKAAETIRIQEEKIKNAKPFKKEGE